MDGAPKPLESLLWPYRTTCLLYSGICRAFVAGVAGGRTDVDTAWKKRPQIITRPACQGFLGVSLVNAPLVIRGVSVVGLGNLHRRRLDFQFLPADLPTVISLENAAKSGHADAHLFSRYLEK